MRLKISRSQNSETLYMIRSIYRDGKNTSEVVERLGSPLEISLKYPGRDPYEWAREYIARKTAEEKTRRRKLTETYNPSRRLTKNERQLYFGGYLFLQQVLCELDFPAICTRIAKHHNLRCKLSDALSYLVYARLFDSNQWHSAGHSASHSTGHSAGYSAGYSTGHSAGYSASQSTGHSAGFSSPEFFRSFIEPVKIQPQQIQEASEVLEKVTDSILAEAYRSTENLARHVIDSLDRNSANYSIGLDKGAFSMGNAESVGETKGDLIGALALLLLHIIASKLHNKFSLGEIHHSLKSLCFLKTRRGDFIPVYTRTNLTDALHDAFGFTTDNEIIEYYEMQRILRKTRKQPPR